MSPRLPSVQSAERIISAKEATTLLGTLCERYGFCLKPLWHARLTRNPPRTPERFADAVFHAEGLDPVTADSQLYRTVLDDVKQAFERSEPPREAHDV
jgi:hypothetical protein